MRAAPAALAFASIVSASTSHVDAAHSFNAHLEKRASTLPKLKLVQNWQGDNFWQGFRFFNEDDPTHGAVDYVPATTAVKRGLAYIDKDKSAVLKVDATSWLKRGELRKSVRLESKKKVQLGSIVIADFAHVPFGAGVWPAFWLCGDDWPTQGEVDIFENVNDERLNQYTLHTSPGCYADSSMDGTGTVLQTDCDAFANYNVGCGIEDTAPSFGSALNAQGGGVFATYFGADEIAIWFFPRNAIPKDIQQGKPNKGSWPKPRARWTSNTCDIRKFFKPQRIVINITLCGDWAGNQETWASTGRPGTCVDAVLDPANYKDAYFKVKSVKVYQS